MSSNSGGGGSVLLQFLSSSATANPKRRMEKAVLDEDTATMRELVNDRQIGVNDELTAQSALTAMHLAARADRPLAIKTLVELGANPLVANFLDQTPLECALSAGAPRALLELARRAQIGWRDALTAFRRSNLERERQLDNYASFTMHLLAGLMQPAAVTDPAIVCACLTSYARLVADTTEWAEERIDPPLRPSRALFPTEEERAPIIVRYVADSPFLLDELMRPEAFLSALLGVYNCSDAAVALVGRGASQLQAADAEAALLALTSTRESARQRHWSRPQSLRFACRNAVRRAVATADNYIHAVYQRLPLDFATRAFLVYGREVDSVMNARPRTRYTGLA